MDSPDRPASSATPPGPAQQRRRLRPGAGIAVVAAALAAISCATTQNFLDPAGPRYTGGYGRSDAGHESAPPAGPVRVVTFNVKLARDVDGAIALLAGSEALRDPDILLLQEMDSAGVERIARARGLNYAYFPSSVYPTTHREFGTAVLSPWRLEEERKIVLPHASFTTRVSRAVTTAVVCRGDMRIRAYAVHLPAPLGITEGDRREQVRIITADAAGHDGMVVVGGDFNDRGVGPWFRDAGFRWLTDGLPGTARGLGSWWSFDHVFARRLRPAGPAPAAGVVDAGATSDHRAVWVLLEPDAPADRRDLRPDPPAQIAWLVAGGAVAGIGFRQGLPDGGFDLLGRAMAARAHLDRADRLDDADAVVEREHQRSGG